MGFLPSDSHTASQKTFPHKGQQQKGKPGPAAETSQEAAYLKSLGEKQKPISIKLLGGEVVQGWIEYYDRDMVRLTRDRKPNLFIYKHDIMYIEESASQRA